MENKIDCEYTKNITCPYCWAIDTDSWECMPWEEDLWEFDCDCGNKYIAHRDIEITYSTQKI
jgi:hypothetical protein